MGAADPQPQYALLVEQGVDHAGRSEPFVKLGGDVVDAALRPDILASDDDVGVRQHQVRERPAQQPRHVLRLVHHVGVAREQGAALLRGGAVGEMAFAFRRQQARHHRRARRQLRPGDRLFRDPIKGRLGLLVDFEDLLFRQYVLLDQQGGAVDQRVAFLVPLDLRLRQIGRLNVRSGMAVEPDAIHVEKDRLAPASGVAARFERTAIGVDQVEPAAADVAQRRAVLERRLYPARRGSRRNADPIVLAQEDEGHGRALISCPLGGVERALRGGVIGRGVTEAAQDDPVFGDRHVRQFQSPRYAETESGADRLRQMRGDGAGLGRDGQRFRSDDLVATAGNRVLRRRCEAQEHVPGRGLSRHFLGSMDLEGIGAIMEEGEVVGAEGFGDGRIVFVARAADRVEALAARLQASREPVHLPARHLTVEELGQSLPAEAHFVRLDVGDAPRQPLALQLGDEFLVNGFCRVHDRPAALVGVGGQGSRHY